MNYYTNIDTVGIQVEFENADMQRVILEDLLGFIHQRRSMFIDYKEYAIGLNMKRGEYSIYLNNTIVATIYTGAYERAVVIDGQKKRILKYYIAMKFAGLKCYDEKLDAASYNVLMLFCSYFNSAGIPFAIIELDICLDVECRFEQMVAICAKKSPKTHYYGLMEPQTYATTIYLEKIEAKKVDQAVRRSYYYDKGYKEGLTYPLTRFEVKLQPKYFGNHGYSIESIMQALDHYYVMYFEKIEEKNAMMVQYEKNQSVRKRKKVQKVMQQYRLWFDSNVIREFLEQLYAVRLW